VLIYPDARGLHQFYKEFALRCAEVGIAALAIDFFGRTAGINPRDDTFDYRAHMQHVQLPTFFSDVTAALAYLRTGAGLKHPTFTIGFCMGGSLSFFTGTEKQFGLSGVIGLYGGLSRNLGGGKASVLEEAEHIVYPLLGLFGGADQSIPVEQVQSFDDGLDRAGVEHEIKIYPGAPHSFFDRRATDFAEESTDAWQRILNFITTNAITV